MQLGKGVNVFDVSKELSPRFMLNPKQPSGEENNIWSIYEDSYDNFCSGLLQMELLNGKTDQFQSFTKQHDHLSNYSIRSIL